MPVTHPAQDRPTRMSEWRFDPGTLEFHRFGKDGEMAESCTISFALEAAMHGNPRQQRIAEALLEMWRQHYAGKPTRPALDEAK